MNNKAGAITRSPLLPKGQDIYNNTIISLAPDHAISRAALAAARNLINQGGHITAVHMYKPLPGSAVTFVSEETVAKPTSSVHVLH